MATVAALLNGGKGPPDSPWPTVAQGYVYDSLMDDIRDVTPTKRRPTIIVRTDEDRTDFTVAGIQTGRRARLLIEISVITAIEVMVNNQKVLKPDWPQTDSALEAFLDMMEWQVHIALFGYGEWARWYNEMEYGSLLSFTSTPRFAPPDRGAVRLAVRTLELVTKMPKECLPEPLNEQDAIVPSLIPPRIVTVMNHIVRNGGGDLQKAVLAINKTLLTYGAVERPRYPAFNFAVATVPDLELEAAWQIEQAAALAGVAPIVQPPTMTTPNVN